ncbi:biopolymer transporter ExbB [Acidihalobacter aeolianus]|uniref:Biopolymer transporter ExbB n=1 Tax=Acidihalobacter aeolianus TaxID=2792603 RepID=A0A1D8K7V6_9GAMM|nr:MotA/TolQ/ExbB proton channel family protein [Acidihalobacter aeolianus]AOV17043.1 biopolymer transporter ExbB [Acidihalobacter aeolianus]
MFEIVKAGGWVMAPIIGASILALAIILERFWSLRRTRIMPRGLLETVVGELRRGELPAERIQAIATGSPLGRILAVGLANRRQPHEMIKERIEETGRQVVHDLERFLNTLGTIATISPLMGLLGTVFGMIQVFGVITSVGVGNPHILAGGIAKALITTAAGLLVAIPAHIFFRYFRGYVDALTVEMEDQSIQLVDSLHNLSSTTATVRKTRTGT